MLNADPKFSSWSTYGRVYNHVSGFTACERMQERPAWFWLWPMLGYLVSDRVFEFSLSTLLSCTFNLRDFWRLMRFVYLLSLTQSLVQDLLSLPWNTDKLFAFITSFPSSTSLPAWRAFYCQPSLSFAGYHALSSWSSSVKTYAVHWHGLQSMYKAVPLPSKTPWVGSVNTEVVHEESVWMIGTSTVLKESSSAFCEELEPIWGCWRALRKASQAEPFWALTWSNCLFPAQIWATGEGRAVPTELLAATVEAEPSGPQGACSGTVVRYAAEQSTTLDVGVTVLPKPCWRNLKVVE